MILTCHECETKFLVKAEDLGEKGRKVRCGNCAHIWHQAPPEPEAVAEEKVIAKNQQANLKAAVAEKAAGVRPSLPSVMVVSVPPPRWLKALVVVLVIANAFSFVWLNKKLIGQTSFYDKIGQYQTAGAIITDNEISVSDGARGDKKYSIQWAVQNTSKEYLVLPARRIRLLDKDLKVVSKGSNTQQVTLEPGQKLKFEPNKVVNEGGKGKYLVLEIGNPYELSLR